MSGGITYIFDELEIEIGQTHPELDRWLDKYQLTRWLILTAENPNGEEFPGFVNKQRTGVLRSELGETDYPHLEGKAVMLGYPEEKSFLILGISLEDSVRLAQKYDQVAIVTGEIGQFAEVLRLED